MRSMIWSAVVVPAWDLAYPKQAAPASQATAVTRAGTTSDSRGDRQIRTGTLGRSRQFSYLFLREVEPDSVVGPGHGADGDGDFLAAPQVSLLEQHVGHPVIARADEEALHPPDLTIDGVDRVPGPHLLLTHRNNVFEDRRLPQRCGGHALAPGCLGVIP